MRRREYKHGTRWCVWRWKDVIGCNCELYLRRLHLLQTPFGSICLHWIKQPDLATDMHDHPVTFLSVILRGSYVEERGRSNCPVVQTEGKYVARRWFNFIRAADAHRITDISPSGVLTLCFMGPVMRKWGFHTPRGWVHWKEYRG